MKTIVIKDIPVEIEKKRIKNMYLKILPPDGRVHINAPLRMPEDEIQSFVRTKLEWIREQQAKLQKQQLHQECNYVNGDIIYIWGQGYQLSVIETSGRQSIRIDHDKLILTVKAGSTVEQRKKLLDQVYRELLNGVIPELIAKWEARIGVHSSGYHLRAMKTRWGTCNIRTKIICLNLHLAKKPLRCLEYVIVHELVHLLESSHNHVFKGYLDHYLPHWRMIKKEMNGADIS